MGRGFDWEPVNRNVKQASSILKAMSNPHRLLVICQLAGGEKSVGELEKIIGLSQSGLSQHLAQLRRQNLVKTRRQAQAIFYFLDGAEAAIMIERAAMKMINTASAKPSSCFIRLSTEASAGVRTPDLPPLQMSE